MNTCPHCGYIDPEWCSRCGMTGTHTQACAYMKTPPERGHRSTSWHRPATDQNTTRPPKKGGHFQRQNENDNHVIRGGGQTMLDLDGTGE